MHSFLKKNLLKNQLFEKGQWVEGWLSQYSACLAYKGLRLVPISRVKCAEHGGPCLLSQHQQGRKANRRLLLKDVKDAPEEDVSRLPALLLGMCFFVTL